MSLSTPPSPPATSARPSPGMIVWLVTMMLVFFFIVLNTVRTEWTIFHFSRFRIAESSIPKEAAYQIINDELMLDGNPRLNLASFVTTWMEPECDKLIMESINKNYVDMDEYPVTTELQVWNLNSQVFWTWPFSFLFFFPFLFVSYVLTLKVN